MKLIPVMISVILAISTFGYGLASAQTMSTHCTASTQCLPICGDHVCAPGEVYSPGGNTSASTATQAAASTNGTNTPAIQTQLSVSANATVTRSTNSTGVQESTSIATNVTATKNNETQTMASTNSTMEPMNGTGTTNSMNETTTNSTTSTTVPPPAPVLSPEKQVSSGTASADVKCEAGYQLVLNKFDSRPACVTPEMMAKLVARGWASS